MQKLKVLLIGNGRDGYEKEFTSLLADHALTRLEVGEDGVLRLHGFKTDIHSHFPSTDVVINLPNQIKSDHYHQLLNEHHIPNFSYKSPFHHLFPQRNAIEEIARNHDIIIPSMQRIHKDDINENSMKNLFHKIILPVRIKAHGAHKNFELVADSYEALQNALFEMKAEAPYVDIVREVKGDKATVFAVPNFRGEDVYVTIPAKISNVETQEIGIPHLGIGGKLRLIQAAKNFFELFPEAHAMRLDVTINKSKTNKEKNKMYLSSLRPISVLKPQPTFREALKLSGSHIKEYYNHLLHQIVNV